MTHRERIAESAGKELVEAGLLWHGESKLVAEAAKIIAREIRHFESRLLDQICDILKCPDDAEALLQSVKGVAALEKDAQRLDEIRKLWAHGADEFYFQNQPNMAGIYMNRYKAIDEALAPTEGEKQP